jgi:hypothetical protein
MCFECNKPIDDINDYRMVGIDIPYVNLFFHKSCFMSMGGYGGIREYITQRSKQVYNYLENINKTRKNR